MIEKRRRPLCTAGDDDDDDKDEETELVTRVGSSVFFYADVSKKSVLALYAKIDEAHKHAVAAETADLARRVYVHIHSDGGCAYSALAALYFLRRHPCAITTVADGFCASAATLIFLAGKHRVVSKHAGLLIHQLRTSFYGKYADLKDEFSNSTRLMATMRALYKESTRVDDALLDRCFASEEWLAASECVEHGIAHEAV